MFLVGISLYFRVDQIPGELGDNRFNMYVLEHGYRWLVRLDKSFWSAPFFYPAPNVITYSDNHLGSFLFYSVFRLLGAGTETAFQLWAITIFCFNYFVTWLVLRKQQCHPLAAAAAAYIFTFGLKGWRRKSAVGLVHEVERQSGKLLKTLIQRRQRQLSRERKRSQVSVCPEPVARVPRTSQLAP
jgi:hypothetical protein